MATKTIKNCLYCNKPVSVYLCHLKFDLGKGNYCSRSCQLKNTKGKWEKEKNPRWNPSPDYRAIHKWVQLRKGKANKCTQCGTLDSRRYHWANISHNYLRDLSDWIEMCPKCNYAYDHNKMEINLGNY